ncbi:unnamed protein product [Arctia plantaginis]|uniref:Transmembrane inner ear expressed protein n=1 Tax=Arctia plantaginis TaxID=874455 RepID=A0A8S0ZEJ1_ARCPL|nr:unnamed protein product [Arctia plantaginis]
MDLFMDVTKNSEEPQWLESKVIGNLRVWQIMFLCFASITTIIVMVCCCFRFRIPRTKQQIEADYQRRKITNKFRAELETIQDAKMDAMSLKDVFSKYVKVYCRYLLRCRQTSSLDLLHGKKSHEMEEENQPGSQPSSIVSPQQSSLDASFQPESGQKPEPQASGLSFVKFASKVATVSKLGQPKSPTSPTPSSLNKMEF